MTVYRPFVISHCGGFVQDRGMKRACVLLALLAPVAATAQALDAVATLEVLPGWQTADGTRMTALAVTLAPGWKTYWRSPGDAGIPPQIDFAGSQNIRDITIHWPVPEVFDQAGMRSIGWHDGMVLPVELHPARPGGPIRLSGTLDIGVCEDICIPVQLRFDQPLPQNGARDGRIVAALVDRPLTAAEAGVTRATCAVTPAADGLTVTAQITVPSTGGAEAVVIEAGDPAIWVSEPDVTRVGDVLSATVDMVNTAGTAFALDRSGMRVTILGRDRAVDIQGCTAG